MEKLANILIWTVLIGIALLPTIIIVSATLFMAYNHELLSSEIFIHFYAGFLLLISPLLVLWGVDLVGIFIDWIGNEK